MENNTFKTAVFGGFDRQDVIQYIERFARESAEAQDQLMEENEKLRQQVEELTAQTDGLTAQVSQLTEENEKLTSELNRERSTCSELEPMKEEVRRLTDEVNTLRPDAAEYTQFWDRMGSIERDSRKRAADLEDATAAKLRETVDRFQTNYQELMRTFETAAAHVTGELRKVEVNLTQLPRAMDKSGADLNELAAMLERVKTANDKT